MSVKSLNDKQIVSFSYCLTGPGCADGHIGIGKQGFDYDVSYLCDPLTELLDALLSLSPAYALVSCNTNDEMDQYFFTWLSEPMAYVWTFSLNKKNWLHVRVRHYDADVKKDKGVIILDASCDYIDFLASVIYCLESLLRKHGLVGIYKSWSEKASFPLTQFLMLKHYLNSKKAIKTRCVNAADAKSPCSYAFRSNLSEELKLLIK